MLRWNWSDMGIRVQHKLMGYNDIVLHVFSLAVNYPKVANISWALLSIWPVYHRDFMTITTRWSINWFILVCCRSSICWTSHKKNDPIDQLIAIITIVGRVYQLRTNCPQFWNPMYGFCSEDEWYTWVFIRAFIVSKSNIKNMNLQHIIRS